MNNIAIFLTDNKYTNDYGDHITLEQHLRNVYYGATPDTWEGFDRISEACKQAEQLSENGNPCLIVDLSVDATHVIERFE